MCQEIFLSDAKEYIDKLLSSLDKTYLDRVNGITRNVADAKRVTLLQTVVKSLKELRDKKVFRELVNNCI